jgi:uncharacterized membrane protein
MDFTSKIMIGLEFFTARRSNEEQVILAIIVAIRTVVGIP